MAPNLEYKGTLPYATELFGVYQPLLGWKSRLMVQYVDTEIHVFSQGLFQAMLASPQFQAAAQVKPAAGANGAVPLQAVSLAGTHVGKYVSQAVESIHLEKGRLPTRAEWKSILKEDRLQHVVAPQPDCTIAELGVSLIPRANLTEAEITAMRAVPVPGAQWVMARASAADPAAQQTEMTVAATLCWLNDHAPLALSRLFARRVEPWETQSKYVDPLANFDAQTQLAVLSPIGVVHLYREYFFELDTFLGPPVGHLWLSPGGTVELVEVNTRRQLLDKTIEALTEETTRSELSETERDEISDAVKEENQRNIKFGMSASWGTNWVVAHAEGSANFGIESTSKRSSESTHKHMREQSEKLSSEIRRSYKTTFRTVTEVTDTSSRRYVLQNTSDKLANYELRRKMRKVAVQVQHIGTQLCWQAYVDAPGSDLGVAELVHVASPEDLDAGIQPPQAVAQPQPKNTDLTVHYPYQVGKKPDGTMSHRDIGDDFVMQLIDGVYYCKSDDAYIVGRRKYKAAPPAPGYNLVDVALVSHSPPVLAAARAVTQDIETGEVWTDTFELWLDNVNFDGNTAIDFVLKLTWEPSKALLNSVNTEYNKNLKEYTEARSRKAYEEYVSAVRDRIKKASNVPLRDTSELREEERIAIYRRLVRQLMQVGSDQSPHITSELVRALFDVDKMLYFVAPDWWMPRANAAQQFGQDGAGGTLTLSPENRIGWGGVGEKGRKNYLITEDAQPARLGSSIGWLLQLDGDNHRNAFLNSPWVKAVIPIHPGRERAALNWLQQAHIEGADDSLDANYTGPEPELQGMTIRQALEALADKIGAQGSKIENALATEKVFEKGFDPLEGGFQATGTPYEIFDQWIEVLPTDQVVAKEYAFANDGA